MEDAGTESAHGYVAVLQAADGGGRRTVDVVGHILHGVLLSPMAGRIDDMRLVGSADVAVGQGPACGNEVGSADAGTGKPAVSFEYGAGLLDLFHEAAGLFLRGYDRTDFGDGLCMGLSEPTCRSAPLGCNCGWGCALSAYWGLRTIGSGVDGTEHGVRC